MTGLVGLGRIDRGAVAPENGSEVCEEVFCGGIVSRDSTSSRNCLSSAFKKR